MLQKLDSSLFDWLTWRAYSIKTLGVFARYSDITSPMGKRILRKYAIGWCDGGSLLCRPKADQVGVMFFKDGEQFWFHLRKKEFKEVFGDE